jgi:UDP-glucose 4-epimerase
MLNVRKVIVTGGAGFIGSHISEELLRLGCKVLVIDNLYTGKIENIEDILKNPDLQFIQGSITDASLLNKFSRVAITYSIMQLFPALLEA